MPPALRKRPVSPAGAAATLTHPTHRSSTHLPPVSVAPRCPADARLHPAVSR